MSQPSILETSVYELILVSGARFEVECSHNEIDQLIDFIGETNIKHIEQI